MQSDQIMFIDVLDDPPYDIFSIYQSVFRKVDIPEDILFKVNGLTEKVTIPKDKCVVGVIISGSVHHVGAKQCSVWQELLFSFIQDCHDKIPILGVCFGHQLIARALGGVVGENELGKEIGTIPIYITDEAFTDELFVDFPTGSLAQETHIDHVVCLPDGATILAYNKQTPIQAFRIGMSWGIQFHPELTPPLFVDLLKQRAKNMKERGLIKEVEVIKQVISEVKDSPESLKLLKRFVHFCLNNRLECNMQE